MSDPSDRPAGLMVLRLWSESGQRMRVRITLTPDVRDSGFVTYYASDEAEVVGIVERWLHTMVTPR